LSFELQNCAKASVFCWLATVDCDGQSNVSPKEVFMCSMPNTSQLPILLRPGQQKILRPIPRFVLLLSMYLPKKGTKSKDKQSTSSPYLHRLFGNLGRRLSNCRKMTYQFLLNKFAERSELGSLGFGVGSGGRIGIGQCSDPGPVFDKG